MAKQMETFIHEGKAKKEESGQILKAAAYCRVSTLAEAQDLSYESQSAYFEKMIKAREDLTLVGIYGDHGLSGLHASERPELQRMLADAREGKIDVIFAKSISRIARNAIELQTIIDEMNSIDVQIVFEKEGLVSNDPQLEIIVKFLAAIAQEESNSTSQAIKWSQVNNIKNGNPTQICSYGFRKKPRKKNEPHVWEIFEPEAKLVRRAYGLALRGTSSIEIARVLNKEQKKHPEVKQRKWTSQAVKILLQHEANVGDLLTNKTYKPDYLSKRTCRNLGERDQYYIEDHHPAIVSREVFNKVNGITEE